MSKKYSKPPTTIQEQVALLQNRGLLISDEERLKRYLRSIGYFRLSGYAIAFQKKDPSDSHQFRTGTNFDHVLSAYVFDRKLRLLVLDALERIEVAFRVAVSHELSVRHGSHWFMDSNIFSARFCHTEFITRVKREIHYDDARSGIERVTKCLEYILHYYSNYEDPDLPPSWMVFETLSFGTVSNIFNNLKPDKQKIIAKNFNMHHEVLASWIHSISHLRNLVAHHSRLWNRIFTIKPKIAKRYSTELADNSRFYAQAVILQILLSSTAHRSQWAKRLFQLLEEYRNTQSKELGFPNNWNHQEFWKQYLEN